MPKSLSAIPVKGMMHVGRFEPKDVTMLRVSVGVERAVSVGVECSCCSRRRYIETWLRRYSLLLQAKFPGIPMPGDRMFPECADVQGCRRTSSLAPSHLLV